MRTGYSILLMVCVLAFGNTALAKIYQWTDKDGNVHFTDTPPTDTKAIERTPSGGTANKESVERLEAERAARAKAREEAIKSGALAEQEAKDKEIRAKNCEIARERLRFYTEIAPARRVRVKQENGDYYWKTPEDIKKDAEEARKLVEEWC